MNIQEEYNWIMLGVDQGDDYNMNMNMIMISQCIWATSHIYSNSLRDSLTMGKVDRMRYTVRQL